MKGPYLEKNTKMYIQNGDYRDRWVLPYELIIRAKLNSSQCYFKYAFVTQICKKNGEKFRKNEITWRWIERTCTSHWRGFVTSFASLSDGIQLIMGSIAPAHGAGYGRSTHTHVFCWTSAFLSSEIITLFTPVRSCWMFCPREQIIPCHFVRFAHSLHARW